MRMARLRRERAGADPLQGPAVLHQQAPNNSGRISGGDAGLRHRDLRVAALTLKLTAVTKSLDTRFLRPAAAGVITARAQVVERTDRDMVVQADLVDAEGITVADA